MSINQSTVFMGPKNVVPRELSFWPFGHTLKWPHFRFAQLSGFGEDRKQVRISQKG
jgi:hypothetical protein